MSEIWKPVKGYEERYEVSDQGRVRNTHHRVLTPSKHRDGYLHVKLCNNGKLRNLFVHRLVATAFIPTAKNKPEVDHIDGVKRNNSVSNLEWVDRRENMKRAVLNGRLTFPDNSGEKNGMAKITEAIAREIKVLGGSVSQTEIGRRYGISRRAVGMIISGARWPHV
ncbi:NUMOD4 motif-containing HNH endonuclease [Serratia marcescens]|uniref:NUMOD4 motif-containing HNH endonuclease n=1 Tax=Serratia marcescens TaxID=615 RepID=UPI003D17D12B